MYNSVEIAERIKKVAKLKKMPLKYLLESAGIGRNAMSHLTSGSTPNSDNLAKIADCLDVSMDFLMGRTDNPEVNK